MSASLPSISCLACLLAAVAASACRESARGAGPVAPQAVTTQRSAPPVASGSRAAEPSPPREVAAPAAIPVDGYEVVRVLPHDSSSFTQGLAFDAGELLESQGEYGRSSLRVVDLETGTVARKIAVDARYFAEGLTALGGFVYQLTWKEGVCLVYERHDLRLAGTLPIAGEGWGLATDGKQLIVSDGSDVLRFCDPATMRVARTLAVKALGRAQHQINELEWVRGEIWANVWHSDRIARIDPATGEVKRYLDLTGLLPASERPHAESVLNGIAWDARGDRLYVTGKRWPKLFEIRVVPRK